MEIKLSVYRHYDANGRLLYVGRSSDVVARMNTVAPAAKPIASRQMFYQWRKKDFEGFASRLDAAAEHGTSSAGRADTRSFKFQRNNGGYVVPASSDYWRSNGCR